MKILVIDDKSREESYPRKELLNVFSKRESVESKIIEPEPTQLKRELDKSESGEYDLIIVDYMFEKSRSIFKTGISLYSLIRSYTDTTPIYLISVKNAPTNQIGDFELFISDSLIEEHSALRADIESHIALRSCRELGDILALIKSPEELNEDLETMLGTIISKPETDQAQSNTNQIPNKDITESLNLKLFKWLARSLLRKEGPLVSTAGAAELLGVSTEYFDRNSSQFDNALYRGIFCQSFEKRWWVSLLEDYIYDFDDTENYLDSLPFKEASALLLGASNPKDFSTCVVCNERYPDGLGIITDGDRNELFHVHISCSTFNEALSQEAFFRNPRIIEIE
ncbi:hypothetical protein AKJ18_11080 [Vibrio xuii]|nr:hypothetical protein AKJ18_11080 [Vibrio xuii]